MFKIRFLFLALCFIATVALAQDTSTIEKKTQSLEKKDGFFPIYWDEKTGKLYLEISRLEEPFLYVVSQPAGLGSNDIGLDRGQLGGEQVVYFEQVGQRIFLVKPNLEYRANSENQSEKKAIRDSFAESILWGFDVVATSGTRVLVEVTNFVVRDAHNVVNALKNSGQGTFRFDSSRSAPFLEMTKAFPNNTEMEAKVTFTSDAPGGYVRQTAADATSITLRVRHSFIKLPIAGYKPRKFDPRSGYFGMQYEDYTVPIGQDKTQRLITRHRLEKVNPNEAISEVKEPIVYYLDPGTPEPVRSALLDGARWWASAFEAAGFKNAYRVEILPEGADPMDARYNVIQWVHRATRGWSYGSSITDPRTGEIIKGHVSLGSLRVRQDYLIAQGLLAPFEGRNEIGIEPENDPMLAMALARLRQLSAHEVGHTLGLAHNFASSVNNRASVMDYPAPLARIRNGEMDLSDAYDVGIGEWDKVAIQYGYAEFSAQENEAEALNTILENAKRAGLFYITDSDARAMGGAHPQAHLWDNGTDAVQMLRQEMDVRAFGLQRFDESVIKAGEPLTMLEEVLVPLYLRHRYQVEATSKLVGGVMYTYALRGEIVENQPLNGIKQRDALDAILATISPETLALPEKAIQLITPRPPGSGQHRELFDRNTGLIFDILAPAETVAQMVFDLLLHPQRAARLNRQHYLQANLPNFEEVLIEIEEALLSTTPRYDYHKAIQTATQRVYVDALMMLLQQRNATEDVKNDAYRALLRIQTKLKDQPDFIFTLAEIDRFLQRNFEANQHTNQLTTPPGSPIGQSMDAFMGRIAKRKMLLASTDNHFCTYENTSDDVQN